MKQQKHHMKLFTFVISLLLAFPALLSAGELTETRQLNAFDKIIATNGINVLLRKSHEEKVDVRIENALLSDVITEVNGSTLKLKMRPQINKELSVLVVVYYKSLKELSVSKGASVETKTVILQEKLKISASTGGSIKAEVECTDLKADAGGGSAISLYGWAKRFETSANTKANVYTKTLNADKVIAKAATGAEVWVKPKVYLEAIANTGGTIYYISVPEKLNERVASGGEVRNKSKKYNGELQS